MDFDDWIKKYYPTPAECVPASEALEHSIRKWQGLRPEVLKKYGLKQVDRHIVTLGGGASFEVNGESCALCQHYNRPDGPEEEECMGCPLFKALGHTCDDGKDPYGRFTLTGDPEPMIAALEKARKFA